MKAVTWQARRQVQVQEVPDPRLKEPNDAIVRVTSTGICGSDLHLYEVLGAFMTPGDILGHEAMGIVEEVGSAVENIALGDRVVIPFNISCGNCFMCTHGLHSQCETTQVSKYGTGAALFGYTKLYGQIPGGQAELVRVPQAQFGPIKVPEGPADDRFVFLSDVLPTAWQAVEYAGAPEIDSLLILGLGPIGDMATRVAQHRGIKTVIAADLVPERLSRARSRGIDVIDVSEVRDVVGAVRERTQARGVDAVIDAVGMEAHGSPVTRVAQNAASHIPNALAERLMLRVGVDRLAALQTAIDSVRRGGTISLSGVYGGMTDPLPMMRIFDKQIQLRMGQANVRHWVDELLPLLLGDDDPLGVDEFATHHLPIDEAADAYEMFQKKADGAVKVLLRP